MGTIIIAEVGINANGSIDIAKKLIDGAKEAGCDLIKFQKRNINSTYSQAELDKPRESPWGNTNRDQKFGLEFNEVQYDEIDAYCKKVGLQWFASPWDLPSVEFLKKYNLSYNKVASALLVHKPLLHAIAEQKKMTFISTGMSTFEEIDSALRIFDTHKCPYIIMHCNSQYPCPENKINLNCLTTLYNDFGCAVGYSSHCVGIIDCVAAVAMGASVIEKHITLDRAMYGSDQSASVEITGFRKMVEYIRVVEQCMGGGIKIITPEEEICKAKLRRERDY